MGASDVLGGFDPPLWSLPVFPGRDEPLKFGQDAFCCSSLALYTQWFEKRNKVEGEKSLTTLGLSVFIDLVSLKVTLMTSLGSLSHRKLPSVPLRLIMSP